MWYLKRGVVLTKDNLARRNWNGNKACCFCSKPKTIQHLFVECHYAKFLWRAIHLVLGIPLPVNIELLFNNWSKQGGHKHNILLLTGAAAICWSIWLTKNDTVFNNYRPKLFCGCFSGGHIGSGCGLCCSTLMTKESGQSKLASFQSLQVCNYSHPMDDPSFYVLVFNFKLSLV